jgi:hypothetical protein
MRALVHIVEDPGGRHATGARRIDIWIKSHVLQYLGSALQAGQPLSAQHLIGAPIGASTAPTGFQICDRLRATSSWWAVSSS